MSGTRVPTPRSLPTDLETVVDTEIKEWHFHIYFHQNNHAESQAALRLRDAVLRLRREGAFVAVPLFRVNHAPIGPHPVGSYEIWVPSETFSSVFSYLCMNRGDLSILVHPLTREERRDHELRNAWIGPSFPLDLSTLHILADEIPLQYAELKLGYSSESPQFTLEERRKLGAKVEEILSHNEQAAPAPSIAPLLAREKSSEDLKFMRFKMIYANESQQKVKAAWLAADGDLKLASSFMGNSDAMDKFKRFEGVHHAESPTRLHGAWLDASGDPKTAGNLLQVPTWKPVA